MKKECRTCNQEVDAIFELMPENSIHYGKTVCPVCGRFIDWVKKPDNQNHRTKSSKFTPELLNKESCELCGRERHKLGARETLEVHHKDPVEDGGQDTVDNLLVLCTPCHRMAHFLRTYLHKHLDNFYAFGQTNK